MALNVQDVMQTQPTPPMQTSGFNLEQLLRGLFGLREPVQLTPYAQSRLGEIPNIYTNTLMSPAGDILNSYRTLPGSPDPLTQRSQLEWGLDQYDRSKQRFGL